MADTWKVIINGKDSGIIETNYEWASKYWANKAKKSGKSIKLVKESTMTKSKKFLKQLKEAFMKKQVFKDKGLSIDTKAGTYFLPTDVIGTLHSKLKSSSTDNEKVIAKLWPYIKDYVEVNKPEDVYTIEKIEGWFGRLSAPGYMDATDYVFDPKSEQGVIDTLDDMYGDEDGEVEESFKKKPIASIKTKEEARELAVDWQNWQSQKSMSWQEVSEWGAYFEEVAKKFGLTKEFQENGII